MKKIIIITCMFVLFIMPIESLALTNSQIKNQVNRINPSIMKYVKEIQLKDKADYSIPNMIILADANTNYVITIYQNNITDNQLYDLLLHEAGHIVYWKTKQTYPDMEKWADYFRIVSKWGMPVDDVIKYINWVVK